MKKIRIGTIGTGTITQSILDNVTKTEGICLEAVYSRAGDKAEELAGKYGAEKTYTDLNSFMADGNIDLVYIATPNILHYEQAMMALKANKHVLCEKPMCLRAKEVEELMKAADENKLMLAEAVPTPYLPNFDVLCKVLPRIGRIKKIDAVYAQYSSRYDRFKAGEVPNVFNPEFGGGCLMDLNFYNIYLTVALFGKPVKAVYHPDLCENGIDVSGLALLDYASFTARLYGAKDKQGDNHYTIEGERGLIKIRGGSNGLKEIGLICDVREEVFDLQPLDDRWYYEIKNITPMFLAEDIKGFSDKLKTTYDVISVLEKMRKDAGISFPGDVGDILLPEHNI